MKIRKPYRRGLTRRDVIRTASAAGIAAGAGPFFHASPARAAKTLRILQWSHFVPGYDRWFNNTYTKEWGKANDTEVTVDNINLALIESRAAAEVSAQKGHDLVMFLSPPAVFEDQVVDMKDVYAECEKRHGKPIDLAIKSTYNPKTKRYFAFSDSFVPDPVNYRTDLWGEIRHQARYLGGRAHRREADQRQAPHPGRHRPLGRARHCHGNAGADVLIRRA